MNIRPCIYPHCDDGTGNPELTLHGACDRCRRRYHRLLGDLALDWTRLRITQPAPAKRDDTPRRNASRSYGHPAEWASDMAADITAKLNGWHDALADVRGDIPPPHPGTSEAVRVRAAHRYLTNHLDNLVTFVDADDAAAELHEVHGRVRSALGYTRLYQHLKGVPCMQCGTQALILIEDHVECGECGIQHTRDGFGILAAHAIDVLIDSYDAAHDTPPGNPEVA